MAIESLLEKVQIEIKEVDACTRTMEAKYSAEQVDGERVAHSPQECPRA